ncbi:AAA family ATPase [Ensifer sp. NPDC090286]|uniref:AAA family ATPase n=1 Tax=Ensifer sp. NPDC090286 TaxID=3363991 RepID=UPI00383B1D13
MVAKYVDSMRITNFIGKGDVYVVFDDSINFIIGLNGTGKTTLINLLRASLNCDSHALREIEFAEVQITFLPAAGKAKPILTIKKNAESQRGSISYQYKENSRAPTVELVSHLESRTGLSRWQISTLNLFGSEEEEHESNPISEFLPKSIWLPLHRGLLSQKLGIGESSNPIDRKISQLVVTTTKYLSSLDTIYSKQLEEFQQNYFLSLLNATVEKIDDAFQLDMDEEQANIEQIFKVLFKDDVKYKKHISTHFDKAKKSISTFKNEKALKYNDFIAISDTIRLHKLIENWKELQQDRVETFRPKIDFSNLLNDLLVNKKFRFDERNQPTFTAGKKTVDIAELSSGEKQLFIMLTTSLIQENSPFVYLADEPELSLHIEWQRRLVDNLKSLNASAQIIFATHSPDIVAGNQRQVIRMEDLLRGESR